MFTESEHWTSVTSDAFSTLRPSGKVILSSYFLVLYTSYLQNMVAYFISNDYLSTQISYLFITEENAFSELFTLQSLYLREAN